MPTREGLFLPEGAFLYPQPPLCPVTRPRRARKADRAGVSAGTRDKRPHCFRDARSGRGCYGLGQDAAEHRRQLLLQVRLRNAEVPAVDEDRLTVLRRVVGEQHGDL